MVQNLLASVSDGKSDGAAPAHPALGAVHGRWRAIQLRHVRVAPDRLSVEHAVVHAVDGHAEVAAGRGHAANAGPHVADLVEDVEADADQLAAVEHRDAGVAVVAAALPGPERARAAGELHRVLEAHLLVAAD